MKIISSCLVLLAVGCVAEDESLESTDQEATVAASVPVGDPIAVVAAPPVYVTAQVGDSITLTTTGPVCSTTCNYTWRDPDHGIARYGGVILGYGPTLTVPATTVGSSRVTLNYCIKTSARFSRCIYTYVYVTTTAAP